MQRESRPSPLAFVDGRRTIFSGDGEVGYALRARCIAKAKSVGNTQGRLPRVVVAYIGYLPDEPHIFRGKILGFWAESLVWPLVQPSIFPGGVP